MKNNIKILLKCLSINKLYGQYSQKTGGQINIKRMLLCNRVII